MSAARTAAVVGRTMVRRRKGSNVIDITGALRIMDRSGAVVLAQQIAPLGSDLEREAGVQAALRECRRDFRKAGLRDDELEGAIIVAEALLRKELGGGIRRW